ncbi:MAG: hypothetical protein WC612_06825 [Bdellovibrionales bacterium]|jgi:hypothetical protein
MRAFYSFFFLFLLMATTPVLAGSVTYADMRGRWQSTQCTAPATPAALSKDAEAAANDLNTQKAAHNKYVTDMQDYMNCLTKEAERDAEATGILVTKSAQALIDKAAADLSASTAQPVKPE